MESVQNAEANSKEISAQALSFLAFESAISLHLPDISSPLMDRRELIAVAIMILGALAATIAAIYLPSKAAGAIVLSGLLLEILSALFILGTTVRKELPAIRHRRRIFASDLDSDSRGFRQIVAWLKTHPEAELEEKLLFTRKRLEPLNKRFGLLFGSIDRLGFLPILVALYLQFKDTKLTWPPDVNVWSGLLGLSIFVVYIIGLWAISLRLQLEGYIRFLEIATEKPSIECVKSNILPPNTA